MKPAPKQITISSRFQRSVRIDADDKESASLDGVICPESSREVLNEMARHLSDVGQGAFTWTGPYGSGKSTLALLLSALLGGDEDLRTAATKIVGVRTALRLSDVFIPSKNRRLVLPIIARRAAPFEIFGEALVKSKLARKPKGGWTEPDVIDALKRVSNAEHSGDGLLVIVDELGKCLEAAVQDGADLFSLQELAEAANRSGGRLVLVGILHQAFGDYASRLSRNMRDEWSKIQGRYVDLSVNTAGEEQIDLIGRAIMAPKPAEFYTPLTQQVARMMGDGRSKSLAERFERCWPLHPVVASLLGPISRRRFGQNQRSVFGFLNSVERYGFQDFLSQRQDDEIYMPARLWDYLRSNLESSILSSPDSHRWATSVDAIERLSLSGASIPTLDLLKSVAVIDLFSESSGIRATEALLKTCCGDLSATDVDQALGELRASSAIIFRKFSESFSIFAGSDFDIERAIRNEMAAADSFEVDDLKTLLDLQPILAKRHYHQTGAMRWFDIHVVSLSSLKARVVKLIGNSKAVGQFVLSLPINSESDATITRLWGEARSIGAEANIIVGRTPSASHLVPLVNELKALKSVSESSSELAGDPVARREVDGRIASVRAQLESEIQRCFDQAEWKRKGEHSSLIGGLDSLNGLASIMADKYFENGIRLPNELLNRDQPSSSARSAQNALLNAMISGQGAPRLGISGYPPEGGLYASLIERPRLYRAAAESDDWHFVAPTADNDPANLLPMWQAARAFLRENEKNSVELLDIFDLWQGKPFGIKPGLLPVLGTAFILAENRNMALYYEGVFRTQLSEVDVERLAKNPHEIQLRWMKIDPGAKDMLAGLSDLVTDLGGSPLQNLVPLDVAKGLVRIFDETPRWTHRTSRLSAHALRIRDTLKRAHDPIELIFDDLPAALSAAAGVPMYGRTNDLVLQISDGMREIVDSYPEMLSRLRDLTLEELQVPNLSAQAISELQSRAVNIRQIAGDYRIEAFVIRLASFDGTALGFAEIVALSIGKNMENAIDLDIDRASVELVDMAQRFLRAESFARVKGREQTRRALSVVIGMEGSPAPVSEEFAVQRGQRADVERVIASLEAGLQSAGPLDKHIILAALTELSLRYMDADVDLSFTEHDDAELSS